MIINTINNSIYDNSVRNRKQKYIKRPREYADFINLPGLVAVDRIASCFSWREKRILIYAWL